jgi:hypothetical protein
MKAKRIWPWTLAVLAVAVVAVVAGPPIYRWAYAAMMPPLLLCEARNDTDTDIAYQLEDATGAFPGDWIARASGAPAGPLSPACFYGPDSRRKPVEVRWGPKEGEGDRYPQRTKLTVPRPDDAAVLLLRFTAPDRLQARFATAAEMPEPVVVPESVWNSGDWVNQ